MALRVIVPLETAAEFTVVPLKLVVQLP
jgi:hypothetical protein